MNNWNTSIILVEVIVSRNENDFPITIEKLSESIPANIKKCSTIEELSLKKKKTTKSKEYEVIACNYSTQTALIDESTNKRYTIRKTVPSNNEMLILYCDDKN